MPTEPAGLVLFDGDCGICTVAADHARRLDTRGAWRIEPYQSFGAEELAALGLDEAQCAQYLRVVDARGRVHSGALAVNRFLWDVAPWSVLVGLLYVFPALLLAEVAVYELVARNRTKISSWLGLNACRLAP